MFRGLLSFAFSKAGALRHTIKNGYLIPKPPTQVLGGFIKFRIAEGAENAASKWKSMTAEEKAKYRDSQAVEKYQAARAEYDAKYVLPLKKAPGPYANFVKKMSEGNNSNNKLSLANYAQKWKALSPQEKAVYKVEPTTPPVLSPELEKHKIPTPLSTNAVSLARSAGKTWTKLQPAERQVYENLAKENEAKNQKALQEFVKLNDITTVELNTLIELNKVKRTRSAPKRNQKSLDE